MNIHIIDLDNVVHIGSKAGRMGKFNTNSIPTGGIYRLLGLLKTTGCIGNEEENKAIVLYDTRDNWRRQIYPEYKGNRSTYKTEVDKIKDKAVRLQKEMLIPILKEAGITVIGMDGMEADDLMFNIVYSMACSPEQPLQNNNKVVLHSSDGDWLGALGLTSNIFFSSTNSNSEKISSIKSYYDYQNVYGTALEYHYIWKAVYGDIGDNYTGHRDQTVMRTEEMQGLNNSNYWNYFFWEMLTKKYHADVSEDIMQYMLQQLRLAFPIYHPEIYEVNYIEKLTSTRINRDALKRRLDNLRVNILSKELGQLNPYTKETLDRINIIKKNFKEEYEDVFKYYATIEYAPKIEAEDVEKAFNKTIIKKI